MRGHKGDHSLAAQVLRSAMQRASSGSSFCPRDRIKTNAPQAIILRHIFRGRKKRRTTQLDSEHEITPIPERDMVENCVYQAGIYNLPCPPWAPPFIQCTLGCPSRLPRNMAPPNCASITHLLLPLLCPGKSEKQARSTLTTAVSEACCIILALFQIHHKLRLPTSPPPPPTSVIQHACIYIHIYIYEWMNI